MPSDLYWIDASGSGLAIMARPRAGYWLEDEIDHWQRSGVGIVVSLLKAEEVTDLGLEREIELCEKAGVRFLSFPIPDRGLPFDPDTAMRFAAEIADMRKPVAIHCRAGIGRSSIMAAAVLVSEGVDPQSALAAIEKARGLPIPDTEEQRVWVMGLEKS
ncbi:protein-tyrosine phosphatase family protein [Sphingomonas sp. LT1P40]|uniref:protein-tyrosine phosphatase family protein n=1 Tax=Alteristakelama amylovorans TaxID=3096166 RepID=UPI002FC8171F